MIILLIIGIILLLISAIMAPILEEKYHNTRIPIMWFLGIFGMGIYCIYLCHIEKIDAYKNALKGKNPYKMEILYDKNQTPKDTIFIKK